MTPGLVGGAGPCETLWSWLLFYSGMFFKFDPKAGVETQGHLSAVLCLSFLFSLNSDKKKSILFSFRRNAHLHSR